MTDQGYVAESAKEHEPVFIFRKTKESAGREIERIAVELVEELNNDK
jgi:hypothetical protein